VKSEGWKETRREGDEEGMRGGGNEMRRDEMRKDEMRRDEMRRDERRRE